MVNANNIHLTHQIAETTNPPIITILLHNLPVVLRVAPQLASLAEIIWRYTSHLIWSAILIQLEELLMRPGIGTIQRNKDRHISHNLNALLVGIFLQILPLLIEHILLEMDFPNLKGKLFLHSSQSHLITADKLRIPLIPALAIVPILQHLEQGIIPQPVGIFLGPSPIFIPSGRIRHGNGINISLENQGWLHHLCPSIISLAIVDNRSILQIRLSQEALFCQKLQRNQQWITGKGRGRSIRRIACPYRIQRQNLPYLLSCRCQEINKLVCLWSQITNTKW